jgi:hypothetical protein
MAAPTDSEFTIATDPEEQIDDLFYLARTGELAELTTYITKLASTNHISAADIVAHTVAPDNGNSLLHYAAANGETSESFEKLRIEY